MTSTRAVMCDLSSEEYFTNPYDTYRRMRDETLVYYNKQIREVVDRKPMSKNGVHRR